ncbi:hypothetical protein D9615_007924 [Tricholomella constricta]|uniref:Tetrapyrrole biosynthesis uroporphyrinogen III synthase domain-containing protein n=1 Tax=Tricholomella constricta TaxID=117010 RepID=A0A8H5LZL1_9AGAR|nr:hypothetical protein D9615_007924 [Tricholomella constricta]
MTNALLLRAPSSGQDDRYETTFNEAGYHALSVPVLETISTNIPTLREILKAGPAAEKFEGVVLTSARSCEAWKTVVGDLVRVPPVEGKGSWSAVPFYVVGQGTAAALTEVHQTYGQTPYTPEDIRGESSGTGERLAQFIRDQPQGKPKKLLYLTGDKNRDTVPTILGKAGIDLRALKVYETQGSHTFERDLEDALKLASTGSVSYSTTRSKLVLRQGPLASQSWWIIHFAPSAAGFVMPILNNHFCFEHTESNPERSISNSSPSPSPSPRAKVAAIGPVTSSFLRDEFQIHVEVVPPSPTPQDLVAAIVSYDRNIGF